ncbi:hypothetical protein DFH11DRAFT_431143 [Phellopilus nigrolimitatus]|nr:hypothetical protein DFH11DRAFT_431143 [Phellopilus nigrolimitatus]
MTGDLAEGGSNKGLRFLGVVGLVMVAVVRALKGSVCSACLSIIDAGCSWNIKSFCWRSGCSRFCACIFLSALHILYCECSPDHLLSREALGLCPGLRTTSGGPFREEHGNTFRGPTIRLHSC